MQESEPIDPPERELEEALRGMRLAPMPMDGERLWYAAGLAAGRRRASAWRAAAAVVALAAGASLLWRPKPPVVTVDRVVVVQREAPPFAAPLLASEQDPQALVHSADYLRLRDEVVQNGWQSLPVSAGGAGESAEPPRAWPLPRWNVSDMPQRRAEKNTRG
jgi:hypothetical protein